MFGRVVCMGKRAALPFVSRETNKPRFTSPRANKEARSRVRCRATFPRRRRHKPRFIPRLIHKFIHHVIHCGRPIVPT